uniref:Uncharacterized protein n=1 Tax=Oryza meridionalis TaxID=40149 RepID=A0A0E0EZS8_9ORYZ
MHLTLSPGRKAAHARTASHPCHHHHHHPELARLDGGVRELMSWTATSRSGGEGSSGLALVEAVLAALGEVLELPMAVAALHGGEAAAARDDAFLVLADAYGTFESALLALRESVAGARCGARRGDGAAVAAALRARRRTEKELCRLAGAMRQAASRTPAADATTGDDVGDAVAEAAAAIAAASEAVFLGCATMPPDMSSSMASTSPSKNWLARLHLHVVPASKKVSPETATATAASLERLEECIGELESGSEKVFRRLLQTRVSLLNIHNPL